MAGWSLMGTNLDIKRRNKTPSHEIESVECISRFFVVLFFSFQTVDQGDEFLKGDDSVAIL